MATMTEEIRDLRDRLHKAKNELFNLEASAESRGNWKEADRLADKRSGINLALSYTEEYMR